MTTPVVELTQDRIPLDAAMMGTAVWAVHMASKKVRYQLYSTKLCQDIHKDAHTADHHQSAPGNLTNSRFFIGTMQYDQDRSCRKGKKVPYQT